jgi:hypothetical protein
VTQKEKITLTLPAEIMNAVREESPPRGHSQFIAEAVAYFVQMRRRQALRERLIAGYRAVGDQDQALVEEWRPLEEEVWAEYVLPMEEQG